ncbi:MAG: NADH-quinone oxidoreductase subunit G [Thiotrichales bacterium]|jgi:NADH-quinone oxidoreductase subunit G|nr:NADH-quinone oxidoreductase subunit G [Thiotrichales bacterium]MBT3613454.1 NADH-quinone oxidoreductase subunit G [Thiotrichales bacterium]MBT3753077.1 NADH-quinone oxidoreductase subunit G [Thiotrichales bacterium]MBT3837360.1 NADH-quinone oxidoreductase subunit G [Thiotrichales bacterium]MBT4151616.1 NADH-quinone oxidoreductase subunit G [Thiotrichales bacterium]
MESSAEQNIVNIEINDISLQVEPGQMLIEVADANGVAIPRFCYHKKLSTSANCRMCLVEVEKAPKMLPACATQVMNGMKVWTKSPKAIAAQKSVMEFLLINHPLDCPVCDQGGECDLQDIAMGYGGDQTRYQERRRIVKDKDYGALVSTEMSRCIHCTRCVRFGEEVGGIAEIGGTGRGDHMEIGTYVQKSLSSELSGNIIDLCPVGALLSKPFLYSARAWELQSYLSIAPHDAVGSNIKIQTRNGKIMRVVPADNEEVNESWISDRDRFSYLGANESRVTSPMVRNSSGNLVETNWQAALDTVIKSFTEIIATDGGSAVGAIASPSSSVEEFYLLQKFMRGLGSNNIDFRLQQQDFSAGAEQSAPKLELSLQEIETQNSIFIIGSDIQREQPLLSHRVRKATLAGAVVSTINPKTIEFNFAISTSVKTDKLTPALAGVAKELLSRGLGGDLNLEQLLTDGAVNIAVEAEHKEIADSLVNGENSMVLLGALAYRDQNQSRIYSLATAISKMSNSSLNIVTEGANALGGVLAGAVPYHSAGKVEVSECGVDVAEMISNPPKGVVLFGVEADKDLAGDDSAIDSLGSGFVVAITPFMDRLTYEHADVVLPLAGFGESSGTFVNAEGRWQSFSGAVKPLGEARPGWKILRVLGSSAELQGFELDSSEQVLNEVKALCDVTADKSEPEISNWSAPTDLGNIEAEMVKPIPLYEVDAVVRRSAPLQEQAKKLTGGVDDV